MSYYEIQVWKKQRLHDYYTDINWEIYNGKLLQQSW